jgi:gamma-glutamyl hydrolase
MIGIISVPVNVNEEGSIHSYIYNTYIQWIYLSGGHAILIPYDIQKKELHALLKRISGVIWVGGSIQNKKKHSDQQYTTLVSTLRYVYDYAILENKYNYFPIWGTCLGMQMLLMFAKDEHLLSKQSFHEDGQTSFIFTEKSRMKKWFPKALQQEMSNHPCVQHHHRYGYEVQHIEGVRIVSIQDNYINAIEFERYPFYGVQSHPERPFSDLSLEVAAAFSSFFQRECEHSKHIWEWDVSDFKKNRILI